MDTNPIAWGLDIGHSSIKAVKISRGDDGATILAYAIEPIATGAEVDREEAVVKAMEMLATREEMGNAPVVASLSGRQIFSRTINIPVINPKKVDKMVELEARQQIPGNFDEVEWSYHLSPAADGASNDVAIFAAKRELIDDVVRKCKRVGINLVGVSVSSLALYNFVRYDQDFPDGETVVILDVGAENTDLVLYQGETLWMRTLAISGNDITKAFMKKFRVSFEEAETLKRQIGESRQADKIFKVIEASINELISEVQRSLGFYKQLNANAKLENIVISGNTFRLPSLPQYLADRLRFAVISLEDLERIHLSAMVERDHFLADLPSLGVAVGTALQGTGLAKAMVNLLPSDVRLQRILRTKRWAGITIAAMIFATILANYLIVKSVVRDNAENTSQIQASFNNNKTSESAAREALGKVGPLGRDLAGFEHYGNHKGLTHAVMDGALKTVESVINSVGPLRKNDKPVEEGGFPKLQAVYLAKVELEPYPVSSEAGPFQPYASARKAVIEVHIPQEEAARGVRQMLIDKLKALPVPAYVQGHPGQTLFSDVQIAETATPTGQESFYYINDAALDDAGNPAPQEIRKDIPVTISVIECSLPTTEPATAMAEPGATP
jgi:type IV pilus assembly protein PilM